MAVSSLTRALGALLLSSAPSLPQRAQAPRLVCLGGNLLPPGHGFSTSSTLSTNDPMWKCRIKYTTRPIGMKKTGGRDHTGRIAVHGIGGGHKQRYRMIDFQRLRYVPGAESGPYEEKVIQVRYDPCRSADIALVAGGKQKRWIIATENMQPGDLLKTSGHIGRMAVSANEGDAYPLGALPVGTLINNLESHPGKGAQYIRAAGTCGCWSEVTGGGGAQPWGGKDLWVLWYQGTNADSRLVSWAFALLHHLGSRSLLWQLCPRMGRIFPIALPVIQLSPSLSCEA
ncbi:39S ribosomal protein L2, mitochondrial isoform X2 [Trachemys scripta elegans]|uniref:39S ribosomal protein L2, mitochondrial isoform X2 n=1 Tax=Trachemys scripta elegans TaxID=31138 RepID=UPI001554039C|nr:39S ribosomal protein L2, mitochondrial isoform X2 [Trachemys scripta elegans]